MKYCESGRGVYMWCTNFTEIQGKVRFLKADVSSVSPSSEPFALIKGLHSKLQFFFKLFMVTNLCYQLVDNAKLPCYIFPPMQHHSFFRNLPPLSTAHNSHLISFSHNIRQPKPILSWTPRSYMVQMDMLWRNYSKLHLSCTVPWRLTLEMR